MVWTTGVTTGATMATEFNDLEADLAALISSLNSTIDGRIALANLNDLADVVITSPATNAVLTWNGTEWIDQLPSGGATNLSYNAATRVLASDTGTDATLPLMSSADAGLVPASGGGTTNFLRADGTFAAPPSGGAPTVITAAPATDQADWNPAGFGSGVGVIKLQPTTNCFLTGLAAGATDQTITLTNDSGFVVWIEAESGASAAANRFRKSHMSIWLLPQESIVVRYSATLSRWVVVSQSYEIGFPNRKANIILPSTTTSIVSDGVHGNTNTATLSTTGPSGTPTNEFLEYARTNITNSTAAGTSSVRTNFASWLRGNNADRRGFFHAGMVSFSALGATGAVRAGLTSSTGVLTTLNSATLNSLLIGAETGQTTLRVYTADAAVAAAPIDLGANFPCPNGSAAYEYCFFAPPNTAQVHYMVRRLDSRFVAQGTLTANLPPGTTPLAQRLEVMVGATGAANTAAMTYLLTQGL